jgi:REP element-mobilizing transposase RayT
MDSDTWNLPAPPGFRGLDVAGTVSKYYRHLPHWRQDGASYFVTLRLADSLPQCKLNELRQIRRQWERAHPQPRSEEAWERLFRETVCRAERWLDQGMGSCVLADDTAAELVRQSLHYFDHDRYELGSHVIMPNHVHLVVRPLQPERYPLEKLLQSWKRYTSRQIHLSLGRNGTLWQQESFDRIVRDEEHLYRCLQYIGRNPARAARSRQQCHGWVRPEWQALGWGFEAER